jgi:hypothetical protein
VGLVRVRARLALGLGLGGLGAAMGIRLYVKDLGFKF